MDINKEYTFNSVEDELTHLSNKAFSIIELLEISELPEPAFILIRRKLLNLGNDILRLNGKYKVGD